VIKRGAVLSARGGYLTANLPRARVGEGVRISTARGEITGVVTAVQRLHAFIATHEAVEGVCARDALCSDAGALLLPLGSPMLGRAIDSRGVSLDGGPPLRGRLKTTMLRPPAPTERRPIETPFWTGIRAIDALLALGRGARIGIFGPAGCGKSTLLHLLTRGARADAVVVALVGERGREAQEWMRFCAPHTSIVCATSDRSAVQRVHAARVAMAQAHALRERGLHVLLIVDSLARFAGALREVAVAAGESVGRAGFPASVFAELACFLEVAGCSARGTITTIATVLSDGDERDPISEAARSLLDGHVMLCPKLAAAGRYPAIDVLSSTSRTMRDVAGPAHRDDARIVRAALASLTRTEDARALGIVPSDRMVLRALSAQEQLDALLLQDERPARPRHSLSLLAAAADTLR